MVKLDHAQKRYGDFCLSCSMQISEGQITGIIGRNGAGKTTAFKAMLGLIGLDGGSVGLFGKDIGTLTAKDREKIGVALADSGFSGYLTVKDYIPVFSAMYSGFEKERFVSECARLELPIGKKIRTFSTGMKRKLQILAALSHGADLLVLDEPTVGLDVLVRDEILDMLRSYMETGGRSIVISSHISSDLEGLCDDIYMIDKGEVVLHEDTDVILSDYGLLKVTRGQFENLDKAQLIKVSEESYGYECLTKQRRFYVENYPELVVENGSLDMLMRTLTQK